MGKQVTVKSGFSSFRAPSPKGYKPYAAGAVVTYTDSEYSALGQSDLRVLSSPPTTVPDPVRPSVDSTSKPVTINDAATGTVKLVLGVNKLTLTGPVTFSFPTGVAVGNESDVVVYATQDGTGTRVATWPAAALAAGGTDAVLSVGAGKLDYLVFKTIDGGTSWILANKQIDVR